MTNADTPRPSADEIRKLVERVRKLNNELCESGGRSWTLSIPVRETDPDVTIEALCAAVESLLEDRELLDWVQLLVNSRGELEVLPGEQLDSRSVSVVTRGAEDGSTAVDEGPDLRAALKQAVGA